MLQQFSPLTRRFLQRSAELRRQPVMGYSFAVLSFALAFVLRWVLDPYFPAGFPFLTFFPAIVLTAFLGGRGPGVLCSVLSIMAAWFVFVPPRWSFELNAQSTLAVAFFVLISVVDVLVIDVMTRAMERLEQEQAKSQALLDQQTTLYHELQHRVANNMQMVSTMMAAQQKTLQHNPEAVDALRASRQRFELISRIHRRLHDPQSALLPLGEFLPGLCTEYVQAMGASQVTCDVKTGDWRLNADQSVTVSFIVIEVITNALKHAFDPGAAGRIEVGLSGLPDGRCRLSVADDGHGLPPGTDLAKSERLGMRILKGLALSLGGSLQVGGGLNGSGTGVSVDFEPKRA